MYIDQVKQFATILGNLDGCLVKAVAYAERKPFDVSVLLNARLFPDMFPLSRQVQAACDAAKFAAARSSGKEAPKHPDTETTVDELRARIRSVVEFLGTFDAADFEGAATRLVPLGFFPGKALLGADYFTRLATPNFYVHATTAYDILRHNGVDVGKADFIGHQLPLRDL